MITGRYLADGVVTEINVGNGMHELRPVDTQSVRSLQTFDIKPRRPRISKEERDRIKNHNTAIYIVGGLPTALCIIASNLFLAFEEPKFIPVAIVCYSITVFVAAVNLLGKKKG